MRAERRNYAAVIFATLAGAVFGLLMVVMGMLASRGTFGEGDGTLGSILSLLGTLQLLNAATTLALVSWIQNRTSSPGKGATTAAAA